MATAQLDEDDDDPQNIAAGSPKPEDLSLSGSGEIRVKSELDFTSGGMDGDMETANGDNPLSCLAIVHDEGIEDPGSASSSAMLARLNAAAADHQQQQQHLGHHGHQDQDVDVDVVGEDQEVDVDGGMGDGKQILGGILDRKCMTCIIRKLMIDSI